MSCRAVKAFRESVLAALAQHSSLQRVLRQLKAACGELEDAAEVEEEGLTIRIGQLAGDMKKRGDGWTAALEGMPFREVVWHMLVSPCVCSMHA